MDDDDGDDNGNDNAAADVGAEGDQDAATRRRGERGMARYKLWKIDLERRKKRARLEGDDSDGDGAL